MGRIESVNVGTARPRGAGPRRTGIDKRPTAGPVRVEVPGPARSGLAGDVICEAKHHGGPDQAVYAYAREDLAGWERRFGHELRAGFFGENLTTSGLDLTGAVVGETWRVGQRLLLQVTLPRVPCATFTGQVGRRGWVKEFTAQGACGAYLRVLEPGEVRAGDPVTVLERPDSPVTIGLAFRAVMGELALLDVVAGHPDLPAKLVRAVARRVPAG